MPKQQNHSTGTILAFLATSVLALSGLTPAAKAAGHHSIVGLWIVTYVSNMGFPNASAYTQWHSDGLEFEGATVAPGAFCQGTYKQAPDGNYHDYHVAWTFDSTGALNGHWDENMVITLGPDGKTYSGTYVRDFYDLSGNFLFEDSGTMTATRLTMQY